ncbi:hypothetical protein CCH79_00007408 [Gambusia affinis]|uniref:Uncharacterized protein n=1 Tax=Gambusia affinis TaxID=33528 RepID=A0A315VDG9_GAMAF|nr:hypothetical protein CCH79_00007408 [Gambusia affinis]
MWKQIPFHPATPGYQHYKDTIRCNPEITSWLRLTAEVVKRQLTFWLGVVRTRTRCVHLRGSGRAPEVMMATGGAQRLIEE